MDKIRHLAQITSIIGGPRTAKKRKIASAVHSAVLYKAPIWGLELERKCYEVKLEYVDRKLALTSTYRTPPTIAVEALPKITPIRLLVEKRVELNKRGKNSKDCVKDQLLEKCFSISLRSNVGLTCSELGNDPLLSANTMLRALNRTRSTLYLSVRDGRIREQI